MKQLYTFSALLLFVMAAFSSCNKQYTCACDEKYVQKDNGKLVWETNSKRNITSKTSDDAKSQCRTYYTTEQYYLNRLVEVQHYCGILED